jgi:RHH-type transcriptional regulator, rel operon repressor / antitoxin RelB
MKLAPNGFAHDIHEHLDDLEGLYLAEQRLIDIRAGKTRTVPLDELMKRYGLDD